MDGFIILAIIGGVEFLLNFIFFFLRLLSQESGDDVLFPMPEDLENCTYMNKFGCWLSFIVLFLLFPIVYICKTIYYLCHI